MKPIGDLLQFVGLVTLISIVVAMLITIKELISSKIEDFKWKYKYKHRFDNPPTAECYCIDCCHYEINSKKCLRYSDLGPYTSDNSFCSEAVPRRYNIEKEEEE